MRKVLLVDDELKIVNWLAKVIAWQDYRYEVCEICGSGLQAIQYLEQHPVDLVITDIRMPGISGLDLIRKLHETRPSVQTVILSGYNQFEYAQKAILYGVKGFLLKPVAPEELTSLLSHISLKEEDPEPADMTAGLKVSDHTILAVVEYLDKNYNKDLCLKNTADCFEFHPAYLGKVFKETTGLSFNTYLHRKRIEQLKKLLTQTDLPIGQLLESVGYHNYEYFYTIFKKQEGISFSEYRLTTRP